MVVKSCCQARIKPLMFEVRTMKTPPQFNEYIKVWCSFCREKIDREAFVFGTEGVVISQPLSWVKKIYPLDALEGVQTQESIRAPKKIEA